MTKYIDIESLGEGQFGEVRKCYRISDNRTFAKKILKAMTDKNVKRFIKETKILEKAGHRNIVKIVDKNFKQEPYYYIMPIYKFSMKTAISKNMFDQQQIIKIFDSILDAMEYAHHNKIIHRDLKPENVLMNSVDDVVVSDFGLGHILDSDSTRITATGDNIGTPFYMAPEQSDNPKTADERSDIYSLGRMLGEFDTQCLVNTENTDVKELLNMVIRSCTAYYPNDRIQKVTELKHAWRFITDKEFRDSQVKDLGRMSAYDILMDRLPTSGEQPGDISDRDKR